MLLVCIIKNNDIETKESEIPWDCVAVLIPVSGDPDHLPETVESVLAASMPGITICVIDNGPKHINSLILQNCYAFTTVQCEKNLDLENIYEHSLNDGSKIYILEKSMPGKGLALNMGIRYVSSDYIICLDADTLLDKDAIKNILMPLLATDKNVYAVGGSIIPIHENSLLCRLQESEYRKAFFYTRMFFSIIQENMLISGAFGAFKKEVLLNQMVDGYDTKCIGEDLELSVKIQAFSHLLNNNTGVQYAPEAICYTHVPITIKSILKQRERWQRGLIQVFDKYPLGDDKVDNFAWWYYWLFERASPVIEILGLFFICICTIQKTLHPIVFLWLFLISTGLNFLSCIYSSVKAKRKLKPFSMLFIVISETLLLHPITLYARLRADLKRILDKETLWK